MRKKISLSRNTTSNLKKLLEVTHKGKVLEVDEIGEIYAHYGNKQILFPSVLMKFPYKQLKCLINAIHTAIMTLTCIAKNVRVG